MELWEHRHQAQRSTIAHSNSPVGLCVRSFFHTITEIRLWISSRSILSVCSFELLDLYSTLLASLLRRYGLKVVRPSSSHHYSLELSTDSALEYASSNLQPISSRSRQNERKSFFSTPIRYVFSQVLWIRAFLFFWQTSVVLISFTAWFNKKHTFVSSQSRPPDILLLKLVDLQSLSSYECHLLMWSDMDGLHDDCEASGKHWS